jgi:transcription initiation factor TFIID subunit TAF12
MAVSNKTYNNVVNFICRLGQYHEQISTISVGDIFDINLEKMEKLPLLHIDPRS